MSPIIGVGMVDPEEIKSRVLGDESEEKSIAELVSQRFEELSKRTYINDPSEAPEGANVQEGQRGGYYYEDDGSGVSGGVTDSEIEDTLTEVESLSSDVAMDDPDVADEVSDAESLIADAFSSFEEGESFGRGADLLSEAASNLSIAARDTEFEDFEERMTELRDVIEDIEEEAREQQ